MDAAQREKLKKFLLLALSSDQPGEAFAALAQVTKLLKKAGHDIHWLAEQIAITKGEVPLSHHAKPFRMPDIPEWLDMLIHCTERIHWLRPREREFIDSMRHKLRPGWEPSDKQLDWLTDIYERLMRRGF